MVKISRTHHVTKKGQVKQNPSTLMIGDGKFPNKYWVSASNDFMICKKGVCDWASETKNFEVKSKTFAKFDTFNEAVDYLYEEFYFPDDIDDAEWRNVFIEDRLSGQIYERSYYVYPFSKKGILKHNGYNIEIESHKDTEFTEEQMRKRGLEFK